MKSKFKGFKLIENSDKERCSNCLKLFDDPCGIISKGKTISWYDRMSSTEKIIGIVEAVSVVFEGLIKMNRTRISKSEDIFMCYDCLFNISELYRNYREFMSRTVPYSFFKNLIPDCILSPEKPKKVSENTAVEKHSPSKSVKAESYDIFTEDVEFPTESPMDGIEIKTEHEDVDDEDYDYGLEVELQTEMCCDTEAESEPVGHNESEIKQDIISSETKLNMISSETIFTSVSGRDRNHRKIERDPNVVQLPNGKWFIPKTAKVLLHKYIPGESLSLDIGKGTELLGREIKVSKNIVLKIPRHRICFHQYRANQKQLGSVYKKTCKFCREVFTNKESYVEHYKNHHEGEDKAKKFQCAQCGKEHVSAKSLWNHCRQAHTKEKTHACITCGKSFQLLSSLKMHMYEVHLQSNEERARKSKIRSERNRRNPRIRPSKRTKKWLEVHPGEVDKVTCEYCGQVLSTPYMKSHHVFMLHKPESERPFGCSFCERRFASKGLMETHEKRHLGTNRNHNCETCGKSFTTYSILKTHMKNVHCSDRKFICETCGKAFKDKNGVTKHFRAMHESKERIHGCDLCDAKFKTKDHMKSHRKITHSEETCLCFECGAKLKTKKTLENHMLSSHGVNANAICTICNRGFSKVSDYEEHMAKGYHIKPLWMRPESERKKRNYNVPSYVRAKVQRKLDRNIIRREKEGLPPLSDSEKEIFIQKGMEEYGVGTEPLRKRGNPQESYQCQQMAMANNYYVNL